MTSVGSAGRAELAPKRPEPQGGLPAEPRLLDEQVGATQSCGPAPPNDRDGSVRSCRFGGGRRLRRWAR